MAREENPKGREKGGEPTDARPGRQRPALDLSRLDAVAIEPGLHLVATPIGHLADISLRALATLRGADIVACEDTRVTGQLFTAFALATPRVPYHDHNAEEMRPALLARLARGECVALVSDAGTPLISDPGFKLVRDAVAAGHKVTTVPGPSAVLAGLSLSGLATDRFYFGGFLPPREASRQEALRALRPVEATLVFFEAARRLGETLAAIAAILGEGRPVAVARELTKRFEEVRRGTAGDLARLYALEGPPKGEVVVVVGRAEPGTASDADEVDRRLAEALKTLSPRDAVDRVAAESGMNRRAVYRRAVALSGQA